MNPCGNNFELTESQRIQQAEARERLAAEVERLKARPDHDHSQRLPVVALDPAQSIGSAAPKVIATMDRARAAWAAFCDSVRPDFDAAPETKACEHHPTERRPKLFEETCQATRQADKFRPVYAPCGQCDNEAARASKRAFWRKRGVPERVIDATLSNFIADTEEKVIARGKAQDWIRRNGTFLLLRGTTGTGKGHLASGCLKAQGNGLWITQADMLSDLRASYTLRNTAAVIDKWREAEMFVLDEFGVSPGGGDEEAMLYQVLADRYDKRRPTVITTNLDRDKFAEAIGYRLLDRIGEDCTVVPCVWESHRKKK